MSKNFNFYYYVSDSNNNWSIIEVDEQINTTLNKSNVVKLKRIIKLCSIVPEFVKVRKTEDSFGRDRTSIYIDLNKVSNIKHVSTGNVKKVVDKISIINAIIEKI